MGKIGMIEILLVLLIIVPAVIQVVLLFRYLKKESLGYLKITEAAQELNNRTLHEAGANLLESNKTKYQMIYLVIVQFIVALLITLLALAM
jgi:hypothetical protein